MDKTLSDSSKVIKFINDFKCRNPSVIEDLFLNGYCYWFSYILSGRFPGGEFLYYPVTGHFRYRYNGSIYDIKGALSDDDDEVYIEWKGFDEIEPNLYRRIVDSVIEKNS